MCSKSIFLGSISLLGVFWKFSEVLSEVFSEVPKIHRTDFKLLEIFGRKIHKIDFKLLEIFGSSENTQN
jgi:hypothetical protein